MIDPEFISAANAVALADRLANDVKLCLEDGLAQRGNASLVVSGGSTPIPFFHALRNLDLDWSKITVLLADERWVPPDHQDSNEKLVREHLLQGKASHAQLIGLYSDDEIHAAVETKHAQIADLLPLDMVVLGMGTDGHTASLFPGAEGLYDAVDPKREPLCCAMFPTTAPHARLSLTLKALLDSQEIAIHITGEEKRQVLEYAMVDKLVQKAPIAAVVCQSETPVSIYWSLE